MWWIKRASGIGDDSPEGRGCWIRKLKGKTKCVLYDRVEISRAVKDVELLGTECCFIQVRGQDSDAGYHLGLHWYFPKHNTFDPFDEEISLCILPIVNPCEAVVVEMSLKLHRFRFNKVRFSL